MLAGVVRGFGGGGEEERRRRGGGEEEARRRRGGVAGGVEMERVEEEGEDGLVTGPGRGRGCRGGGWSNREESRRIQERYTVSLQSAYW